MLKFITILTVSLMLLTGCGCAKDENNDGIVGNDGNGENSVMDNNNDTTKNNNNGFASDDAIIDDMDTTDGEWNGQSKLGNASSGIGTAVDGVGNAIEDIGRGANNVMHDVGNAIR